MAKLSAEIIAEGRQLLIGKDGDDNDHEPFFKWVEQNLPYLEHERMRGTFEKCFMAGDYGHSRACKFYDVMVETYDTKGFQKDLVRFCFKLIWKAVLLCAVTGGCIYLYRVLTGG